MTKVVTRSISLDVFRGLTIAFMILVNSMAENKNYPWLFHASWNGCTLADLVFPFFLILVGASLTLALTKAQQTRTKQQLIYKLATRAGFLFLLGLLLNIFPNHFFDWQTLRFLGVLQRIALCYFLAGIIYLFLAVEIRLYLTAGLLIGYCLFLFYFPVPYYGPHVLTPSGNFAYYFDKLFIPVNHLYQQSFDPEGLFSSFPALATTLIGSLLGGELLASREMASKLKRLLGFGCLLVLAGWIWHYYFPFNKILWTSSYALWTAGLAWLIYAGCFWLIDVKNKDFWTKPFLLLGRYSLLIFVLHVLGLKLQAAIRVHGINLQQYLILHGFTRLSSSHAEFLYALSYTIFWILVTYGLAFQQRAKAAYISS